MTATNFLLRAGSVPVIDYESTGRGFESRPERSCSGSSVGRAVPGRTYKTAAVQPLRGLEKVGYLSHRAREAETSRPTNVGSPDLHDTTAESIGLRAGAWRLSVEHLARKGQEVAGFEARPAPRCR